MIKKFFSNLYSYILWGFHYWIPKALSWPFKFLVFKIDATNRISIGKSNLSRDGTVTDERQEFSEGGGLTLSIIEGQTIFSGKSEIMVEVISPEAV